MKGPKPRPLKERLDEKWEEDANGCWIWTASTNGVGYGLIYDNRTGRRTYAHRAAYEIYREPIPEGMDLDHFFCEVTLCVNPWHVRPASRRENTLRGTSLAAVELARTHCPAGHPYDETNTYVDPDNHRHCRPCGAARARRYRRQRKEAA